MVKACNEQVDQEQCMHSEKQILINEPKETSRIEAFSDGVFSIAITLLILQVQLPQVGKGHTLLAGLGEQWPSYLAYVISFMTILIIWINHHNFFRLVNRVDHVFLILNGLLLLSVTFVNYPTEVLAQSLKEHGASLILGVGSDQNVATIFYSVTFIVISLFFNVLWRYAVHHNRLLSSRADPRIVAAIHAQYRFAPFYYVPATILGFFSVAASLAVNGLLAISFVFVKPATGN
jgi:uncharacterized membrane protein